MKYVNYQSVLNGALGEFQNKGFRLVEQDDHITVLFYCDEKVATFSQAGLTIQELRRECSQWLQKVGMC